MNNLWEVAMVRKAFPRDIDGVEKIYTDILLREKIHGAFTVWKAGVYPTRETAEKALYDGDLYVLEQSGEICASMIMNQVQPEEYNKISWKYNMKPEEIAVIHLLCVQPSKSGRGFGTEMIRFAVDQGITLNCGTIRLDTGAQNKPALALYTKLGFEPAGVSNMAVGGVIEHHDHLFLELKI